MLTRDSIRDGTIRRMIEAQAGSDPVRLLTDEEREASIRRTLACRPDGGDVWVFAYGSLIWNPAIHVRDRIDARLVGWHRRYCLWSTLGRGTPDCPGLMLGLEKGGSCRGAAYRIAAADVPTELDILWRREMVSGSYVPRWTRARTPAGEVSAIAFTINRDHPRYAGLLDDEQVAAVVARAAGPLGTCREYLDNTVEHLRAMGIRDGRLERISRRVEAIAAAAAVQRAADEAAGVAGG